MFIYDPPTEPYLDIIHIDSDILVLNKPAGLLSVPGKVREHKDSLEVRAQEDYPGVSTIHRLDMDTSGLMVMARNKAAHRFIGYQFENRFTEKRYIAHVEGCLDVDEGEVDLPLICDWPNRPKQMVDHLRGKQALTRYRVSERGAGTTRLELTPVTGRSHQLRVHMQAIGHPILGDRFYHPEPAAHPRLMLHAEYLAFRHPGSEQGVSFTVKAPF